VASEFQDDGFHEIQLNGKQLVFLFMAATVVSVVIFLCGVLVGRGVRAERAVVDTSAMNAAAETTPQQPATTPAPTSAGSDPTAAAPPPAAEDLSYFNRLEKQKPPAEPLKSTAGKASDANAKSPAAAKHAAPDVSASAPAASEPSGQGYAVQIAALNVRGEAEAIAKRLTSKGYAAYVLTPADGTPSVYRVRVGKFSTRREADAVAARLQKEEQFKPWVTR
jgi:cell division septation protein DedD